MAAQYRVASVVSAISQRRLETLSAVPTVKVDTEDIERLSAIGGQENELSFEQRGWHIGILLTGWYYTSPRKLHVSIALRSSFL